MKRIAFVLAAAVVGAVALFALLVALVPREALKARVSEQIASWTGRDVSVRGEPEISFFPLSVTLNDVRVSGPDDMTDAEILSMDRLTGSVELLPLVVGRVDIGSFTMVRPLIKLVRDQEGRRNWDFETGAAALQLAFEGDVPLGDFSLEGGSVVYEDRMEGTSERLDSVNLKVDWSSVRQPVSAEGTGIWRGEQVSLSASADAPFAYLSGRETPVSARIEAATISMIFDGKAEDYPDLKADGALKISTPSLRRFASWLGSPIGPGSTLGQASGFGMAKIRVNGLDVENAEYTLDGNSASGALKIAIAPKLGITGTLAFSALDLTPYFTGLSGAMANTADWRDVSLATDWLRDMNADIRLSATSAKLGKLSAGDAAASVSLRDGRLEIGLARAVFGSGSLAGNLAIADLPGDAGATAEAQVRASDIAFSLPPTTFGLPEATSGTGSLLLDLGTQGPDLGSLFRSLSGTARLSVKDGAVPLFGLAEVARAAQGAADTDFEELAAAPVVSATAGVNFSGGVGTLERASVVTADYSADLQGWIGLLDGSLGLNGTLDSGTTATVTPPAATLPQDAAAGGISPAEPEPLRFTIEGTLREPVAKLLVVENN